MGYTIDYGRMVDSLLSGTDNKLTIFTEERLPMTHPLPIVEEVTIEREYDANGNVTKEVRTVRRPPHAAERAAAPHTTTKTIPNTYQPQFPSIIQEQYKLYNSQHTSPRITDMTLT